MTTHYRDGIVHDVQGRAQCLGNIQCLDQWFARKTRNKICLSSLPKLCGQRLAVSNAVDRTEQDRMH
jgi:hypothetical protein